MTFTGTPTTPRQLTLYRENHKIRPVLEWDEDEGRTYPVCAHDRIRLYRRGGGYLHDKSTIRSLAALERGEGIAW